MRLIPDLFISGVLFVIAFLGATSGNAAADTFRARVQVNLCPEYRYGGVSYSLGYRVGDAPQQYTPAIVTQEVNSAQNRLTAVIELPAEHASVPLAVFARCINRFGTGDPAAPRQISYCNHLALKDTDRDGLDDHREDQTCNRRFDFGDYADFRNIDSDGDGMLDNLEAALGYLPYTAASSPKPYILKSAAADFDGDGDSNPVVYRPNGGMWFIRDFGAPGNHLAVQYGLYPEDVPFTYNAPGAFANLGIIRRDPTLDNSLVWYFRTPGFLRANNSRSETIQFGTFGDIPLPGAWQQPGRTNPAVARLLDSGWQFSVYRFDGTISSTLFGNIGDLLKPADYDGDGLLDLGVFRPSENRVYFRRSSDGAVTMVSAGFGSYHYLVEGDASGDGKAEISFWEPINGIFHLAVSEIGFTGSTATQLGLYGVHVPLSYFRRGNRDLLTVIDHNLGLRHFREDNDPTAPIQSLQWGLPGDLQG